MLSVSAPAVCPASSVVFTCNRIHCEEHPNTNDPLLITLHLIRSAALHVNVDDVVVVVLIVVPLHHFISTEYNAGARENLNISPVLTVMLFIVFKSNGTTTACSRPMSHTDTNCVDVNTSTRGSTRTRTLLLTAVGGALSCGHDVEVKTVFVDIF